MAIWAMLLGMATLINITMTGALMSLAGNIPDGSFLAILSRYFRKGEEADGVILYPATVASRLVRLRRRVLQAAAVAAAVAAALTVWALAAGWGTVAMLAVTCWIVAANLAFFHIPLALWRRRAGKMSDDTVEEAWRKSQGITPAPGPGEGEDAARGDTTEDRPAEG